LLDARRELAEAGLKVIQSQAWYEGRYWNTTGIARYVTANAIIQEMRRRNISVLSHGATGRGNDQVRFQLATNMLAPDFSVYAPWRDEAFISRFGGRTQMIEFCEAHKLPISATKDAPYSTDANMLGLTHEAGKLESLETPATFIKPGMGVHAAQAPDKAERVDIRFEAGVPVEINGERLSLLDAILTANSLAGRNGVGIGIHLVENRFVGIKSRGVYESPGMELLGTAYNSLLELVLDRRARELFDTLSRVVSKQIYQGYWYDTATQMALRSIDRSAELVSGTVSLAMYKGALSFVAATDVPHSLYSEENASMEAIGTYNHADSEGFLAILGVSARVLSRAGQTLK
ncbi:MAG: argininosuccinate synthase, partial [Deltaproteobacteria bacterium]|nr:argininosuccinate synthase [Deltaproteobacteria bacterium]